MEFSIKEIDQSLVKLGNRSHQEYKTEEGSVLPCPIAEAKEALRRKLEADVF